MMVLTLKKESSMMTTYKTMDWREKRPRRMNTITSWTTSLRKTAAMRKVTILLTKLI